MREILASIDIGSYKIKLVVAEVMDDQFNVLCALDEESRGVNNGIITEPTETEYSIKKLLKKAEEMLGVKISKAVCAVNEEAADFKIGEASISISSGDKEVNSSDIVRVLQQSTKGKIEREFDLVTVIPIMFKVDDRKTRLPKGMKGDSLSVKSVVVSLPKKDIYVVAKCLEKCGVEVVDIMINSIGAYHAHRTESTDTTTGIMVDCGHETINIAVFNKGIIVNNLVLNIGGINVDKDIGFVYKLNETQSRKIKETFALAHKKYASENEKEIIVNLEGEKIIIDQYELAEVVMSRLHEMLNMAKNEINYLTKKEISYIIITGGLSELKDFSIECESVFGRIASVGKLNIVGARDNKYASCIGMIKYFDYKLKLRDKDFSVLNDDDIETLTGNAGKKVISNDSILGKVFGMFFDN